MNEVQWRVCTLAELAVADLYALLQLRSEVFVLEQRCLYRDIDGLDDQALHLLGWRAQGDSHALLAYARVLPAGLRFTEVAIGRVLTRQNARGTGLGHALMVQALDAVHSRWGAQPVRLAAQAHLQTFYARHGFAVVGPTYVEDGIPHVDMLRVR